MTQVACKCTQTKHHVLGVGLIKFTQSFKKVNWSVNEWLKVDLDVCDVLLQMASGLQQLESLNYNRIIRCMPRLF